MLARRLLISIAVLSTLVGCGVGTADVNGEVPLSEEELELRGGRGKRPSNDAGTPSIDAGTPTADAGSGGGAGGGSSDTDAGAGGGSGGGSSDTGGGAGGGPADSSDAGAGGGAGGGSGGEQPDRYVASVTAESASRIKVTFGGLADESGPMHPVTLWFYGPTGGTGFGCGAGTNVENMYVQGLVPGVTYRVYFQYEGGTTSTPVSITLPAAETNDVAAPSVSSLYMQSNGYAYAGFSDDRGIKSYAMYANGSSTPFQSGAIGPSIYDPGTGAAGRAFFSPSTLHGATQVRFVVTDHAGRSAEMTQTIVYP